MENILKEYQSDLSVVKGIFQTISCPWQQLYIDNNSLQIFNKFLPLKYPYTNFQIKMSCFGNDRPFKPLGRLAQLKTHNELSKRVFGKDITNMGLKLNKNVSNYENKGPEKFQPTKRSRSLYGKKEAEKDTSALLSAGGDAVNEYHQDIIDFMISLQRTEPKDSQKKISQKMRSILIDWLIDVHDSFGLKEQTLHLALNYLSDFASNQQLSKEEYQLVGITCLWIASKYEQIYPPKTKNYVEITADAYTLKQLKEMEGRIVAQLQFNLNRTTSLQILQAISENVPDKSLSLAKYLLEVAYFQGITKKYQPYTLVKAGLSIAQSVAGKKFDIKLNSANHKVPREQLASCFKELCLGMKSVGEKSTLLALKNKFSKPKYHQVSKLKINLQQ